MTFVQVPQQSLYTEELRRSNSMSCDPIFFRWDGLAPPVSYTHRTRSTSRVPHGRSRVTLTPEKYSFLLVFGNQGPPAWSSPRITFDAS